MKKRKPNPNSLVLISEKKNLFQSISKMFQITIPCYCHKNKRATKQFFLQEREMFTVPSKIGNLARERDICHRKIKS